MALSSVTAIDLIGLTESIPDTAAIWTARQNWTEFEVRSNLVKLAAMHAGFASASSKGVENNASELPQRAERLVLGLERLLVAIKLNKHSTISPKLDELFKDVQSRPDFEPGNFAEHLKEFEAEVRKLPAK